DQSLRPGEAGCRHPGRAQDLEVVGAGRVGDRQRNRPAGELAVKGERGHDLQPDRVAQRVENRAQLELASIGHLQVLALHSTIIEINENGSAFLPSTTIEVWQTERTPDENASCRSCARSG